MRTNITLLGDKEAKAALRKLGQERMNIAIAAGVNRTMTQIDRAEKIGMSKALDRPTPFTLNSTRIAKADRNRLSAKLFVMDKQSKYLRYTVEGGRIDTLTPAAAQTDRYGNLPGKKPSRKALVAIARALKSRELSARYGRRRGKASSNLPRGMFIGEINGTYGLWQRFERYKSGRGRWTARPPRLLVKVDRRTMRTPRWDFYGIARKTAERRLADDIREAIARELKAL